MFNATTPRTSPELAQARAALADARAEVAQMRAALDQLSDGVVIADAEGDLLHWNPAALHLHGYDSVDEVKQNVQHFHKTFVLSTLAGERLPVEQWPLSRLLRDEKIGYVELLVERVDIGRQWIVRFSGSVIRDRDGQKTLVIVNLHDLTERYRATAIQRETERRLENQQSLLRTLTEAVSDPLFIKNAAGEFVFVNAALARLAGRPAEACIGATSADVFGAELTRSSTEIDRRIMETSAVETYEESVMIAGQRHDYLITKCRFLNADGSVGGIVGISRDITRLKLAEQQSRDQQMQLAHLERLQTMGHMASGLAHELNQPLGAIVNYAAAARQSMGDGPVNAAAINRSLERIVNESMRAGEIIRRMRMFVKKQKPQIARSDLNNHVMESISIVGFELRRGGVRLDLQLAKPALAVNVDPIQITQVLVNLLRNAQEAMKDVDGAARGLLVRSFRNSDGAAVVQVSDNGVGVSEDQRSKLFGSFYTTKPDGMGVGLALCRIIIENHGGHIEASNNAGRGMTFQISLPQVTLQTEGSA